MLVISALPYGGRELSALRPDDTQRLMRSIGSVMSSRKWKHNPMLTAIEDENVSYTQSGCNLFNMNSQ